MALKVMYTGALTDLSGYASAAREYVHCLDSVDLDVSANKRVFEPQSQYLIDQVVDRKLYTLLGKDTTGVPVHVIHLTPDNYPDYESNGRTRVGYFAWETSRLPGPWVNILNRSVVETWVPCNYLRDVCISSGVTIPIYTVPHAIPVQPKDWKPNCTIAGLPEDEFKFYSIFQWSERKNPVGLLRAYYEEFSRSDPVTMVVKTYRVGNDASERNFIRREISRLKRETKGINCPKVLLIEEFLSAHELNALHYHCDCYVTMARSEGFGIPAFEAAAMGNPVIVPNYSAFPEHFNRDNAYLIDINGEVGIRDMRHISILYTGDMQWSDPSVESCRVQMREVFENQKEAKAKGLLAKDYIKNNLSRVSVGRIMKGRIESLYKEYVNR